MPKQITTKLKPHPFFAANRTEWKDLKLEVFEGSIPKDWYGHVYFNSMVGSVNSGGLPYKKEDQAGFISEYSTPTMNGDGMVYRLDLDKTEEVYLSSGLMKTPDYYADEATSQKSGRYSKLRSFRNMGIARMSFALGQRNMANTAFVPFKFKEDEPTRMFATFDAGRPYEFNPENFDMLTPLGWNKEWASAMPPALKVPFEVTTGTAHPVFDPRTKEFFTVNYTKSMETSSHHEVFHKAQRYHKEVGEYLEDFTRDHAHHMDPEHDEYILKDKETFEHVGKKFERHLDGLHSGVRKKLSIWKWLVHLFWEFLQFITPKAFETEDAVFLKRWTGKPGEMENWRVLDEEGKPLKIYQTMHQMGISEEYIVLIDSAFKFGLDLMILNPFPHIEMLDRLIRYLTSGPMEPITPTYIIKRSDLENAPKGKDGIRTVRCKTVKLPVEAVHFIADYKNDPGKITLHLAHNSAACIAEWVRPYDFMKLSDEHPKQGPFESQVGQVAAGQMDIGRIGKYVVDVESGDFTIQEVSVEGDVEALLRTGDPASIKGPHTWGVGLYTYRDAFTADNIPDKLTDTYWGCFGLNPNAITDFIYHLYKDYPNRGTLPPSNLNLDKLLEYTAVGIPCNIIRQDVETMEIKDFYLYDVDIANTTSVQFVPRKNPSPNIPPSRDGYIVCALQNGVGVSPEDHYKAEFWIFDADNLNQGPICKLRGEGVQFAFLLHTAWTPDVGYSPSDYNIDVRKDYNSMIKRIWWPCRRRRLQRFFDTYVYPNFPAK